MVKRAVFGGMGILIALFMVSFAAAEIYVSGQESVYNIGDDFKFNVSVSSAVNMVDFLSAKIVCGGENSSAESEIYKVPLTLKAGVVREIVVEGTFDNYLVGELSGVCLVQTSYGSNTAKSGEFELTRLISVNAGVSVPTISPGEKLEIFGSAVKANGNAAEGFVEASLEGTSLSALGSVTGGKFTLSLETTDNSAAGGYQLRVRVYERDDFGKLKNEGISSSVIKIKQVPRKLGIAVNGQKLIPGNDLIYTITLYDQTENQFADNAQVKITDPSGNVTLEKVCVSGESSNMTFAKSAMPGNWKIDAISGGIMGSQNVYVEELVEASFVLDKNTLTVTNVGNVPYVKSVEISIGGTKEVKEINLQVGESKKFVISAPDGEYNIGVTDGENVKNLGASFLTGRAIVVDGGERGFLGRAYIFLWIMLIGFVALIAFYQFGRSANKSYYGKVPKAFVPVRVDVSSAKGAESAGGDVITEGKRELCSIVSLKVKDVIGAEENSALENALMKAREAKGRVFEEGDFRTIVFSPSIAGEEDTSLRAIKAARGIEEVLRAHNASGEKIRFGIGVHSGDMILGKASDGTLRANPVDSSVLFARKIAEKANMTVGVSNNVHRKVLGKVKSERVPGESFWRVTRVIERAAYSDFINKFVKNQQAEAAKDKPKRASWMRDN